LRAVRFRALLHGQYHPDTYHALQQEAASVKTLSGSRQLEEFEKMLQGPHPNMAFEDLWELGLLQECVSELFACKGIPQPMEYHQEGDVWNHMMQCLQSFRADDGIDVRLATLFHDCGKVQTFSLDERIHFNEHATASAKITTNVLTRLMMPKKRIEKITWMIEHHMMMGNFSGMTEERKAHWYFHPWFLELAQLFYLDIAGTTPSSFDLYERIMQDYQQFLNHHPRPVKTLLSGQEVMEILHMKPGEEIGKILSRLHDAQIAEDITTKVEARAFLESLE
jgi:tRNA nucleotidyltransferase/poly(A) polymerase